MSNQGQIIWESDNGKTIVIEDPTQPFSVRLACPQSTGYAWTMTSYQSIPICKTGITSVSASAAMTVKSNDRIETEAFNIRRYYWGRIRFTGEGHNPAVIDNRGGHVFLIGPHPLDLLAKRHRMAGKRLTLTFHYARPWRKSSRDRNFTVTVEAAA